MHWSDLLRYIGLAFQLVGIGLAAYGISETRREWTHRPGVLGATRARTAAAARATGRITGALVRRLAGRREVTVIRTGVAEELNIASSTTVHVDRGQPPKDGDVDARLAWLEDRVAWVIQYADDINGRQHATSERLTEETTRQRKEWSAAVSDVRHQLGDFAGGGLRLQAWGVAVLLVGTVLATIPDEIASIW